MKMYLPIYFLKTNCKSGFMQVKFARCMSLCDLAPIYFSVLFQDHLEVENKLALDLQEIYWRRYKKRPGDP